MENNQKIFFALSALGIFIALAHYSAIQFYFYWDIWWFDIMMHTLGGAFVALVFLWFLNPKNPFLIAFVSVLIVGLLWELFEYSFGLSLLSHNFWSDTLMDMGFDILGGIIAFIFYDRVKKHG